MSEWHEDDAFWIDAHFWMFTTERWAMASSETTQIENLLQLQKGQHVYDLCCGVGRHSIELARRGYRVTGLDRTTAYLDEARSRAAREELEIEFVEGDARTPRFERVFDACINMYTSFGYFEDPLEDVAMAAAVRQALRSGGQFLVNVLCKDTVNFWFQHQNWHRSGDRLLLGENLIRGDQESIENIWTLIDPAGEKTIRFTVRLYSVVELTHVLLQAGFSSVTCYGALDGTPVGPETRRLVAVATV